MLNARLTVFFFLFFHDWSYSFNLNEAKPKDVFVSLKQHPGVHWRIVDLFSRQINGFPQKRAGKNSFSGQAWTTGPKGNIIHYALLKIKIERKNGFDAIKTNHAGPFLVVRTACGGWSDLSHSFLWGWIWIHRFLFWAIPLYTLDLVCKIFQ